jgi:predicted amidohydrolase YtcJ
LPPDSWIFGVGWNQIRFGTQVLPTHHALSDAAPNHPVILIRIDAHCAWVNAAALRAAGITRSTPDPYGGKLLRDAQGEPSGILLERAAEPLLEKFPQPSEEIALDAFRAGVRALAANGLSDVYDAGFLPFPGIVAMNLPLERYFDLLRKLDAAEPLPVRIHLMIPQPTSLAESALRRMHVLPPDSRIRISHIKLFADGAFGSRGAAVSRPYADDLSATGVWRMSEDELKREVQRALAAGLDVATHAIGDAAIRRVLDVYEDALRRDSRLNPRRLRVEHISHAQQSDLERAARLGVLLSVQPGFVFPWDDGFIMEDWRLGKEHQPSAYAWATLAGLDAAMAGGSDDIFSLEHPFWNFYAAATRKNPAGIPGAGWHPAEKLSRAESLRLFTDFYAPGGNVTVGRLQKDLPADFVVLSANPLAAAESEILKIKVHATVVAGRVTHSDGTL